ncbi:hypothetical protein A2U01_0094812, partial [Trifolium medium]|nr:hypothetical protein [Trifolium medium]
LLRGFGLLPPSSTADGIFSVAIAAVFMELKIPGPLIPVLDPSSAAD